VLAGGKGKQSWQEKSFEQLGFVSKKCSLMLASYRTEHLVQLI